MGASRRLPGYVCLLLTLCGVLAAPASARAQAPLRKMGEMELSLLGVGATLDPLAPVVPKNVASGVRVVVRAGTQELTPAQVAQFLGAQTVSVAGDISGPGLPGSIPLPQPGDDVTSDPLLLRLPSLSTAGDYDLTNVRLLADGQPALDVNPNRVKVKVIDQILVTSVKTRALTLDEIREKGIVLDSDDYLAFEFTLGLKLESTAVNLSFPVVFDRQGVPVPPLLTPPPAPPQVGISLPPVPTIVPMLLEGEPLTAGGPPVPLTLPGSTGAPIRIPSVLVIPGNVGYLKQFFSAQLFVANGAPVGSGLSVREVTGTIALPPGPDDIGGTADDPLALPELQSGPHPDTLPVKGLGPDGQPNTPDDTDVFRPAEQGQVEFLVRGESEGFHTLGFDVKAVLEGLPVGPVRVRGKASGGVLVRNPFFDMTFVAPAVVRKDEVFPLAVNVTNIGKGTANALTLALDQAALSGAVRVHGPGEDPGQPLQDPFISTLVPGDTRTVKLWFRSERTGQVVASYLNFNTQSNDGATGRLRFALGVGERGVPLSPDTLVLPTPVDKVPTSVVDAALRVLGQAWSIANAPAGTLPKEVIRTNKAVVLEKALALAEAGLRIELGQSENDAVRDILFDFFTGATVDPGFDQLLRRTDAGHDLAAALGARLAGPAQSAGGALDYERAVAQVAASGPDFLSFALSAGSTPLEIALVDGVGHRTVFDRAGAKPGDVVGATIVPLGPPAGSPFLGLLSGLGAGPYALELRGQASGTADLSVTLPRGDGSFVHGIVTGVPLSPGGVARLELDLGQPDRLLMRADTDGDQVFDWEATLATEPLWSSGPQAVSATIVGPETLNGASPFGLHAVLLFDRVVDAASAAVRERYGVPRNVVRGARRQLSGRLVFLTLEQPEGPYVSTAIDVQPLADTRGQYGSSAALPLRSRMAEVGAVVTGRILNSDGTPVPTARVTYVNQTAAACNEDYSTGIAAMPVRGDGSYEFRFVRQHPCGRPFRILTQDPATGAVRDVIAYVRAAGEHIVRDIVLLGRGNVAGVVRDFANQPLANANVVAVSAADPQSGGTAKTDGEGRYEIRGLTVGAVNVTASKGIALGRSTGRIDRAGDTAQVDVKLDTGSVRARGTVSKLEGTTLTPVTGVQVVYWLTESWLYPLAAGVTTTDAEGRYALENMPPGPYRIEAALNTRDRGSVEGTAGGQVTEVVGDIVITIPAPQSFATVTGAVRFPDGREAPDVIVSIGERAVLTDAQGRYSIPGITVKPNQSQGVSARSRDGLRSGGTSVIVNSAITVAASDITLSGLGAVEFTVLDPANRPVSGVHVGLLGACGNACGCAAQVTNAEGRARFEGLGLGTARAKVVRPGAGYIDAVEGSASVAADGETGFAQLRFGGAGVVAGVVLQPDGLPAHGAEITLNSRVFVNDGGGTCGLVGGVSHSGRTDENGRFRFTGVTVGGVSVTASHFAFPVTVSANGHLARDGQQVDLSLKLVNTMSGELSGTVYQPDGVTPAGGVDVSASNGGPELKVKTDAEGKYHFAKALPSGRYGLNVSDPATGGLARLDVYMPVGQDATMDVRLKGRGTVRVRVVDGGGNPVERAFVRLAETSYPNRSYDGVLEAANQGVMTFTGVFEGTFAVEASDPLGRGGRVDGVLPAPGDTVDAVVRLTVTGKVRGTFRMPDGTPIPYGTVSLSKYGVLGQVTTEGTGEGVGSFAFDYIPAGGFRLDAQDPLTGRTGFAYGEITHEGEEVVVDVKAQAIGSVRGRVLGTTTGGEHGEPNVQVTVRSGTFSAATSTDENGDYSMEGVPEGTVTASAALAGGFVSGGASANLVGEGTTLELDVRLKPSGALDGVAYTHDGETPAPVSLVTLWGIPTQRTTTGRSGNFAFARVPEGRYTLDVHDLASIDRARAEIEVKGGETATATLKLNGVGSLRGVALNQGVGTAGEVLVTGTGAFPYSIGLQLGADGTFVLPQVMAGPFTAALTVRIGGSTLYGSASGAVEPGQEANVTIQVEPSGTITGTLLRASGSPAYGSDVYVERPGRPTLRVQSGTDGRFTFRGVPLGTVTVRAYDPISTGRVLLRNVVVATDGGTVALGTLTLDDQAPSITWVSPAPGSSRPSLAGLFLLDVSDVGHGLDVSQVWVWYGDFQSAAQFQLVNGRLTIVPDTRILLIGENHLTVGMNDLAGNLGRSSLTLTITGGTVTGTVRRGGQPLAGAVVTLGSKQVTSGPDGRYTIGGVSPGTHFVTVRDTETGLQSTTGIGVGDGDTLVADLNLPLAARIHGTVTHADGSAAPGVRVGIDQRSVQTAADGSYDLGWFALGAYTVSAYEQQTGDQGAGSTVLEAPGAVQVDIRLNGVGAVQVDVRSASGTAVAGAAVSLSVAGPFPGSYQATTNAAGRASVAYVLAGAVTASVTTSGGFTAQAGGQLTAGGSLTLTATLEPGARIAGHVVRRNGSAAAGAQVSLSGPRNDSTTADAAGAFTFEAVRLGNFTVSATEPNGDRGSATGTLAVPDGTAEPLITLNGLGAVTVVVRDAAGQLAPGAAVTLDAAYSTRHTGTSGPDGSVSFANVLAGSVSASASLDIRKGYGGGVVDDGGTAMVDVSLEGLATIRGRVLQPDALTPAAGVLVRAAGRWLTTGADGAFEFAGLRLGNHDVTAYVDERWRAQATVSLTQDAQVAEKDLVLRGVGTVAGLVKAPGGAAAAGAAVSLHALAGEDFTAETGPDGRYSIGGVPLGGFSLSARRDSLGERVEAVGALAAHGDVATVDLQLVAAAVQLDVSLTDANGVGWSIQASGQSASSYGTSPSLSLVRDGVAVTFTGVPAKSIVPSEDDGREIVVPQDGLLGLEVRRKTYVPADGYFIRHLDVVANPGPTPATIDVALEYAVQGGTAVVLTSSGDAAIDAADRWLVADDGGPEETEYQDRPPAASVFAGAGAGAAPVLSAPAAGRVRAAWSSVTIPAGGSAAFLHVRSVQLGRVRAEAAARRLEQTPPELLAGLSVEEAEAIRNFALPADLVSALAPLPANDGVVNGQVFAGDGVTPLEAGGGVELRSSSLYFGRALSVTWNGEGRFLLNSQPYRPVPREPFTLTFKAGNLLGPVQVQAAGEFPSAGTIELGSLAGRRVVVSSTADPRYPLPDRGADGDLSSVWQGAGGDVTTNGRTPFYELVLPVDARVESVRVRGANYTIRGADLELRDAQGLTLRRIPATLAPPEGDADLAVEPPVEGVRSVRLVVTQDATWNVFLREMQVFGQADGVARTGRAVVDGVFSGLSVVEGDVRRQDGGLLYGGFVKLAGNGSQADDQLHLQTHFRFNLVPPGSYTLTSYRDGATASTPVEVPADARVFQDVTFGPLGVVQGRAFGASGVPLGVSVSLSGSAITRYANSNGSTGFFRFEEIPYGTYTLRATQGLLSVTDSIELSAATLTHDLTFPPVGRVEVTVKTPGGQALGGVKVAWRSPAVGDSWIENASFVTDAAGRLTLTNVPGPTFDVRAQLPLNGVTATTTAGGAITSEGQTTPVSLTLAGAGTVQGTARSRDGVPEPGGRAYLFYAWPQGSDNTSAQLDGSGTYQIPNVPVGPLYFATEAATSDAGYSSTAWTEGALPGHGQTATVDLLVSKGRLTHAGQRDLWSFEAAAGTAVVVRVRGVANGAASALVDPAIDVFGPAGLVASNDDTSAGDKNPRVAFVAAETGTYVVAVRAAGTQTGAYQLQHNGALTYRLYSGATVRGQVTRQADGTAAAGVAVRVTVTAGNGLAGAATSVTDAEGRYQVAGLPAGSAKVELFDAQGEALAERTTTVESPSGVVDQAMVVPAMGSVVVTSTLRGQPFVGLSVSLDSDNVHAVPARKHASGTTGSEGRLVVAGLPAGHVVAQATDPISGTLLSSEGDLAPGGELPLSLALVPSADAAPPAAVADLTAFRANVQPWAIDLSWTAPGDDGTSGVAAAYEIRYSTQPLTPASFGTATVVANPPTPAAAGTRQTFRLSGLAQDVTYYLALAARDENYNWAPISNVVSARDETRPQARITAPAAGAAVVVNRVFTVKVDASDDGAVTSVEIFADGVAKGIDVAAPFELYVTAPGTPATLQLVARAHDGDGNVGESAAVAVQVVPDPQPQVALTAPADGTHAMETSLVQVAASATDDAGVAQVQFLWNGTVFATDKAAPYTGSLRVPRGTGGVLNLSARATDTAGQTAAHTILLNVDANPRPVAPDLSRIVARLPSGGASTVTGQAGAVEAGFALLAEVTNLATGLVVTAPAGADGAFTAVVAAQSGQVLSIAALDAEGDRSDAVTVTVPSLPAGPVLWLKGGEGLLQDGNGRISTWQDQSGRGNHLTQATASARPALVSSALNGLPLLRFDGSDDFLQFTTRLTAIRTVFWVVREDPAAAASSTAIPNLLTDRAGHVRDFEGGLGRPGVIWRANDCCAPSPSVSGGQTYLNGVFVDGMATQRPRTHSVISLVTTGNVSADAFGGIGNWWEHFWWGDLAELLIYDRPLTDAERRAVEEHLAFKFGLTAPTVARPAISPNGGTFDVSTTVTLTTSTPRAAIYYTTDGSEPTTASTRYEGPFALDVSAVLKAKAFLAGSSVSETALASFVKKGDLSPASFPGLKIWVRGDAGIVTDPFGRVSQWLDQSGQGNHLTQATANSRPLASPRAPSGLPVLTFDGNDVLRFTTRLTTIRTVFWVLRDTGTTQGNLLGDSASYDFNASGTRFWHTVDGHISVREGQTWVNGSLVDGTTTDRPRNLAVVSLVTAGPVTADNFSLDRNTWSPWVGDLAELIIYDQPLSGSQRQDIEDYLAAKYKLYVPKAGAPVFNPDGGVFTLQAQVSMASATAGSRIYYTTDGSEPTTGSAPYEGPVTITETTSFKAKAFADGYQPSNTTSVTLARRDGGAFVPSTSGLQLWWKVDAGLSTAAGGRVDRWVDQSGTGNDGVQANGIKQPAVARDTLAGGPVLRFDGGNDALHFTRRLTNIRTVFWVVREDPAATPNSSAIPNLLTDRAGHARDFEGGLARPGVIWRANDCCAPSPAVSGGQTYLDGLPVDGQATPRPKSMAVVSLVTTGNVSADAFGGIGNWWEYYWWGDLAELLIYDRALGATERKSVEDYLLNKYHLGAASNGPLGPSISPAGGLLTGPVAVTMTSPTPGAAIFYTTDGTEPTPLSQRYSAPVTVATTTTVKARAFLNGAASSLVTVGFTRSTDPHPGTVSGLKLWLRADAGVPTQLGDLWQDQSGQGNHGTQSSGAEIARVVPNVVGGLPAMRFDGSRDNIRFTTRLSTIRTVFWVVREDPAATPQPTAIPNLLTDRAGRLRDFEGGEGRPGVIWRAANCCAPSGFISAGQTWLNGAPVNGKTTQRPQAMSIVTLRTTGNVTADDFGGKGNDWESYWWGDLAELLIYDTPLTDADRAKVEAYLAAKYGLSVAASRTGGQQPEADASEAAAVEDVATAADTGSVRVRPVDVDSGQSEAGLTVELASDARPGWTHTASTDRDGVARFDGVPAGRVVATTGVAPGLGWGEGTVAPGATLDLVLPTGRRAHLPYTIDDRPPALVLYAGGELREIEGERAEIERCSGFCGSYARLEGRLFAGQPIVELRAGGREASNGPRMAGEVAVTRRAFVPVDRRFVRYVDELRNLQAHTISVRFEVEGYFGPGGWTLARPASGDATADHADGYAVLAHPEGRATAVVIAGAAAEGPDRVEWVAGSPSRYRARWKRLDIPAGGRVLIAHFVVLDAGRSVEEAEALAGRLSRLQDPEALSGLEGGEIEDLVNFEVEHATQALAPAAGAPLSPARGSDPPPPVGSGRRRRLDSEHHDTGVEALP